VVWRVKVWKVPKGGSKMRVVIPGGGGMLGRRLAADLVGDGHEVILLSRAPDRVGALPSRVKVQRWDGRTADGWGQLVDGAAAVINLAGENLGKSRWTDERKREIVTSRTNPGSAVVAAVKAATAKPALVVQASAVGYYGPRGDEKLTEDDGPGRDFGAQVCVQWEAATAEVEALGVRRAVIRTGVVLMPESIALRRMMMPYRFFAGGPLGSGRQWFSWIHIADYVAGIRFLMDHADASGIFNLSAPEPLTNAAFGKELGRAMGRPSWIPVPAVAVRLVFGEMSSVVLEGQRVVPSRLMESGFGFRFPEAGAALKDVLK
jgi:uncharacterized protein (TIGR01777 family)